MSTVTINAKDRLYVISEGNGYSCLGFDVLDNRATRLAKELGLPWCSSLPHDENKYRLFSKLQDVAHDRVMKTGNRIECELHPALVAYYHERVEVTFENGNKERFRVGRSTGWIPCLLRLYNSRSSGGMAIDRDEKIVQVRIIRA